MQQCYQGSLSTFVGPTKILISPDTLQILKLSKESCSTADRASLLLNPDGYSGF